MDSFSKRERGNLCFGETGQTAQVQIELDMLVSGFGGFGTGKSSEVFHIFLGFTQETCK